MITEAQHGATQLQFLTYLSYKLHYCTRFDPSPCLDREELENKVVIENHHRSQSVFATIIMFH